MDYNVILLAINQLLLVNLFILLSFMVMIRNPLNKVGESMILWKD